VLPDVGGFAVFGFLDGVVFLVRLVLERERITVAAELEVIDLAMAPIMFVGLDTRPGIDRADLKASFAENFKSSAAARPGADNYHVIDFVGHGQLPAWPRAALPRMEIRAAVAVLFFGSAR